MRWRALGWGSAEVPCGGALEVAGLRRAPPFQAPATDPSAPPPVPVVPPLEPFAELAQLIIERLRLRGGSPSPQCPKEEQVAGSSVC